MMNDCVRAEEGVHVQFQGDRESAIFHNFSGRKNDYVVSAVYAAMRMLDKLDDYNKKLSYDERQFDIGIGLQIGDIFASRLGLRGRKSNFAMGQTVADADYAENEVAGAVIGNTQSEIAVTRDVYDYLVNVDNKNLASSFRRAFNRRGDHYISTTSYSQFSQIYDIVTQNNNAGRASQNSAIKPWGTSGKE